MDSLIARRTHNAKPHRHPEVWRQSEEPTASEPLHHSTLRTNDVVLSDRESRIQAIAVRVEKELRGKAKRRSFRGRRCEIVCLTDIDPTTGGMRIYPSGTAAAASIGRCCDNVIQAIRRKGTCGTHRWNYLDEMKGKISASTTGQKVFIPNRPVDPIKTKPIPQQPTVHAPQVKSWTIPLFTGRKPFPLPAIAHRTITIHFRRLPAVPRPVHDVAGQLFLFAA
jgi:hypothetical protein